MRAAIISGILLAFSLPALFGDFSLHLGGLAWIGLVPLYLSLASEEKVKRSFWKGFLCGVPLYGISLYWILIALHVHGGVSIFFSLFALAVLVVILSLYLGGATALASVLKNRGLSLSWGLPPCWILQDWVRNFFPFGGFSWSSLAYGQGDRLAFLQIADLTGPYGVAFLILMANVLFGEIFLFLRKKGKPPFKPALFFTFILAMTLLYGKLRIDQIQRMIPSLPEKKLALVQGNVPQSEKWDPENIGELIEGHLELSKKSEAEHGPDLIIWPEASYPAVISDDFYQLKVIDALKTPLLMGVVSYGGVIPDEWPPPPGWDFRLYNSAMVIRPGGYLEAIYHKNHLVPMGEYVPLGRLFFFVEKLVEGLVDFTPGERFNLLEVAGMKIGATICYEDLFPEISRRFVREGADFLVNLTNDAWYEKSSAVLQHVEFSRLRAIENRRYLARATNTGVTAIFDPLGNIVSKAPLFEQTVLSSTVRLGGPTTFYSRCGDLFLYSGLVFLAFNFFYRRIKR